MRASGPDGRARSGGWASGCSFGSAPCVRANWRHSPALPAGTILAARVEHLGVKEALLGQPGDVCFTTSHFDGHPSILVRLDEVPGAELGELIVEAWLCRAPKRLADEYLAEHPPT